MNSLKINSEKVINIIYQTGQNLKKHFGGGIEYLQFKSDSPADGVTKLDQEMEKFIEKELKKLYPSIGFKGEEYGDKLRAERFWLADPIDGTGYFVRGIPGCTTMIALIEKEEIILSIIYDFIFDNLYYAQKGQGAFLNKRRISVNNRRLKDAFLYVEMDLKNKENIPNYLSLRTSCLVLGDYPSGIHFALTASGKIEGRICQDPYGKDYDFAPGQLLVKEAGGVVTNLGIQTFDYKNLNFLAVNKEVYKDLTTGKNPIFPIKES